MKTPWIGLIGLACLAATNGPTEAPPANLAGGNRFLFVVETSAATARLEHGGRQAVFDLIFTGIAGQMKPGDTFGLWTFNDKVSAGVYPMQLWEPDNNMELATQVGQFLKMQKYQNKARLDLAVKQIIPVLRTVKDLNILIVSDPATRLPDDPLEQGYKADNSKLAARARQSKQPLVTTLVVRNGAISNVVLTVGSEPIRLPPLAFAAATPVTRAPAGVAKAASPRSTRAPIIMKRSEPTNTVAAATPPSAIASPSKPPEGTRPEVAAPVSSADAATSDAAVSPSSTLSSTESQRAAAVATPIQTIPEPAGASALAKSAPGAVSSAASLMGSVKVAARERSKPPQASAREGQPTAAVTATASPTLTERLFSPAAMVFIGALLFLLAAAVTTIFVQKFRRPTHHASFITQGLERQ